MGYVTYLLINVILAGWFQICYIFTPKLGEDSQFDEHIFQMGWFNHQPEYTRVITNPLIRSPLILTSFPGPSKLKGKIPRCAEGLEHLPTKLGS